METENEVKTDPEPQQNGEEKMEQAAENGEGANRDSTSVDQKPGTLIYLYVNVYIVILKIIKCDVSCLSNRSDIRGGHSGKNSRSSRPTPDPSSKNFGLPDRIPTRPEIARKPESCPKTRIGSGPSHFSGPKTRTFRGFPNLLL